MAVFRPMTRDIFDRLAGCSEIDTKKLLEDRVRQHFEM